MGRAFWSLGLEGGSGARGDGSSAFEALRGLGFRVGGLGVWGSGFGIAALGLGSSGLQRLWGLGAQSCLLTGDLVSRVHISGDEDLPT